MIRRFLRLPAAALLALAVATLLTACSDPAGDNAVQAHLAQHADPTWVCPMHPDVVSDEPGECPICGMDLVAKTPPAANPVQAHLAQHADPSWVCPMHPEVVSDEPGECPICGMDLVAQAPAADAGREILFYRHPHRPEITSSEPMQDEMGMDYVPVYADTSPGGGVLISAEVRNNLGVRVARAERAPLPRTLSAVGQVTYDEGRVLHLHARAEGWVEKLHISSVGDRVERGDLLVDFFSPRLATAQEEYLQARRMGGEQLVAASRNRLRALGIGAQDIERLGRTGAADGIVRYRSGMDGVVTVLSVREGMYVRPDTDMVVLANLDRVWVEADVLARQSGWLAPGVPAEVRLDQLPGEVLAGRLAYVYPEADPRTRAVRVRLQFDNPGEVLKPNSFATVTIREPDPGPVVHIPQEAVIRTSDQARVIVEAGSNRFLPRAVVVGYESGGRAAILTGLEAGEQVVVSGQFMLDSEANLRGELDRIAPPSP